MSGEEGDKVVAYQEEDGSPQVQDAMTRDDVDDDPVRRLEDLSSEQILKLEPLDKKGLAQFFSDLGLKELPQKVIENGLNGAVLHSITERDVRNMGFKSLGEAKGFQDLCFELKTTNRAHLRSEVLVEKRIPYPDGIQLHRWFEGPCSVFNRCAMRDYRTIPEQCMDFVTCSPKTMHELPQPKIVVYRDHLEISRTNWNELMPEKYHHLNRGYSDPNHKCYTVEEDNVDLSLVYDVDIDERPKVDQYKYTSVDFRRYVTCQKLERDPLKGDFYWTSVFDRCCGYARYYTETPDGTLTIRVRTPGIRTESVEPEIKEVKVILGSREASAAILSAIEEVKLRLGATQSEA